MTEMRCAIDGCDRALFAKGFCNSHYKRMRRHGDPLAGGTQQGVPLKWLQDHMLAPATDGCTAWPFAKVAGYGSVRVAGKSELVHRFVCQSAHGEPPSPRHEAAHSCGNPICCNPRHLRWATPKENCSDKKLHGTQPVGERVGGSRLTEADVIEMRRLRRKGVTYQSIADKFKHELGATRRVIIGETWSHLPL
jgi:hypothetical protein